MKSLFVRYKPQSELNLPPEKSIWIGQTFWAIENGTHAVVDPQWRKMRHLIGKAAPEFKRIPLTDLEIIQKCKR